MSRRWIDEDEAELCVHGHLQGIGCRTCEAMSRRILAWMSVALLAVVVAALWSYAMLVSP